LYVLIIMWNGVTLLFVCPDHSVEQNDFGFQRKWTGRARLYFVVIIIIIIIINCK
jgi:hypothetical protein